jgi:hypothetical protein
MVKSTSAKVWVDFLYEYVVTRHGCVGQIVTDNGELNSELGLEFERKYRIQLSFTTTYHPQTNAIVERGHLPLREGIEKGCFDKLAKVWDYQSVLELKDLWPRYFLASLWADRITVRKTTGYSPYYLMYGTKCVIPVELEAESWDVVTWKYPMTTMELIAARTKQLARRDVDLKEAVQRKERMQQANKEYFDKHRAKRPEVIEVGDLVLLYESQFEGRLSRKFKNRWTGPYVVKERREDGAYLIAQLDESANEVVAGNRIKKFKSREVVQGTNNIGAPVDVSELADTRVDSD